LIRRPPPELSPGGRVEQNTHGSRRLRPSPVLEWNEPEVDILMRRVLILGAGKIGRMVAHFLAGAGDYEVLVGDVDAAALERLRQQTPIDTVLVDAESDASLAAALAGRQAVISALSFAHNPAVVRAALLAGASYFDLTEDIATAHEV